MTRLTKELRNRNIVFDESDYYGMFDTGYNSSETLFCVSNDLIITLYTCDVLDPQFKIYDKHFNLVGSQDCFKNTVAFLGNNPFCSFGYFKEDTDDIDVESMGEELPFTI